MEGLNLEVVLGIGSAGVIGPLVWKGAPILFEWIRERNAASSALSVQSMSAAGLSVSYMASVLDTLQERIVQMKADHRQEFADLSERYEKRIQELLDEIDGLKLSLAKLGEEQ